MPSPLQQIKLIGQNKTFRHNKTFSGLKCDTSKPKSAKRWHSSQATCVQEKFLKTCVQPQCRQEINIKYIFWYKQWVFEWNENQSDPNQIILENLEIAQKNKACSKFALHYVKREGSTQQEIIRCGLVCLSDHNTLSMTSGENFTYF